MKSIILMIDTPFERQIDTFFTPAIIVIISSTREYINSPVCRIVSRKKVKQFNVPKSLITTT